MTLADQADSSPNRHHFLYAQVLGTYHANVIYTGPGMRDHEAHRLDFLWVRWYEVIDPASSGWKTSSLDRVCFPPMYEHELFGFVDPQDVLRGYHILPSFASGKRHENGVGISRCARDGKDYKLYYVGWYIQQSGVEFMIFIRNARFSDWDLLMHYHWGLGIGHLHAHQPASASGCVPCEPKDNQDDRFPDVDSGESSNAVALSPYPDNASDVKSDNPELGLDDHDMEGWQDVETDGSEDGSDIDGELDSEEDFIGI